MCNLSCQNCLTGDLAHLVEKDAEEARWAGAEVSPLATFGLPPLCATRPTLTPCTTSSLERHHLVPLSPLKSVPSLFNIFYRFPSDKFWAGDNGGGVVSSSETGDTFSRDSSTPRRGHSFVGTLRQGELVKGRRLQGPKKVSPNYTTPVGSNPAVKCGQLDCPSFHFRIFGQIFLPMDSVLKALSCIMRSINVFLIILLLYL